MKGRSGITIMMSIKNNKKRAIHELSLQELFPKTLTDTSCTYIDKGREVWVVTEMCAEYLETAVDTVVVLDENKKPIGIVGGYEILSQFRRNPTRDFQYETKIEQIMFKDFPQVQKETIFKDLIEKWKYTRRAFAVIANGSEGYSPVSARKMLEIGKKIKTNITVSSMTKKKEIITFQRDDSLGKILNLMYEHNTRKLLLENTNQFISDRIILGEISKMLKLPANPSESFLDMPATMFKLEYIKVIQDLNLSQLCIIMDKMDHPYVNHKDIIVTPWDVCLALMSESLTEDHMELSTIEHRRICPHCGKEI